jgi:hypothetical protein
MFLFIKGEQPICDYKLNADEKSLGKDLFLATHSFIGLNKKEQKQINSKMTLKGRMAININKSSFDSAFSNVCQINNKILTEIDILRDTNPEFDCQCFRMTLVYKKNN